MVAVRSHGLGEFVCHSCNKSLLLRRCPEQGLEGVGASSDGPGGADRPGPKKVRCARLRVWSHAPRGTSVPRACVFAPRVRVLVAPYRTHM